MHLTRRSLLSLVSALAAGMGSGFAYAAEEPLVGPIKLIGGRVAMAVTINDVQTFMFAIDTGGATSLINETVAHDLGLPSAGYVDVGIFGQSGPRRLFETKSINYAGIFRQKHAGFVGVPGEPLGDGLAGSLDCGILTTFFCELDYEALEWKVWPRTRPTLSGYSRLDAEITSPQPGLSPFIVSSARVNGSKRRLLLDTGSESFVRLNHDVAQELGLWSDQWPYAPFRGGARITRIDSLDFGGSDFQRPLALLLTDNRESTISDGLIGLPTLRRFNLVCDPTNSAVWGLRNNLPAPAEHYPLSGLWVDTSGTSMKVAVVGTGSPAQKSGMKIGDVILNKDAPTLFQQLAGSQGSLITLEIARRDQRSMISFTLEPYL